MAEAKITEPTMAEPKITEPIMTEPTMAEPTIAEPKTTEVELIDVADQVEEDMSKNLSDSTRHGFIKKVYSILSVQ